MIAYHNVSTFRHKAVYSILYVSMRAFPMMTITIKVKYCSGSIVPSYAPYVCLTSYDLLSVQW